MSKKSEKADYGTFHLHASEESMLVVQLAERAMKNTQKPGQAWSRLQAKRVVDGRSEEGVKIFHLDQKANRLTITEEWGGRETARKTVLLDARLEAPTGPTAPPDPGSMVPLYGRVPFRGADLLPEEDLREWLMERATEDVSGLSVLPRRIRLVGEGFQEVVAPPQALAANVAPGTGATLRALWARPGVERRFVEGWFGSVDGRGTAWILEVGEDEAWWLAMRTFERRPGMVGRWTSAWTQRSGTGAAAVSASLRPILAPALDERPFVLGAPKPPDPPGLAMCIGTLPPQEDVPATAQDVAARVGREWETHLARGTPLDCTQLTVFRGREWETWRLEGDFPMGLDDVIRAISARGAPATSLALVRMGVLPFDGDVYRALVTEGEAQGRRWTRAMLIALAPDGRVLGHRLIGRDHGDLGDDAWIGVPPLTDMSLFTLGPAGGPMPEG